MPAKLKLSVLSPSDVDGDTALRDEWQRRVDASLSLYKLYQSQLWWDHLRGTEGGDVLKLLVVRDEAGGIRGLAPCALTTHTSVHELGGRLISVLNARGLELLGSEPLIDDDPAALAALFGGTCDAVPGATVCRLKSLPADSPAWQFLTGERPGRLSFFVRTAGPKRLFYSIQMNDNWAAYLNRFTAKQRSDLKRKQRLLSEAATGELRVDRITTDAMMQSKYEDLQRCFDEAWKRTGKTLPSLAKLQDAARRRFLRAYLMYAGEKAIAYVIGYQAHGVFHYSDVGFSMKYLKWSPGTVLLFHITRDLADYEPVPVINFGIGSAEYKRRFSNVTTEDGTVYLMRKTVRNRVRSAALRLVEWAWQLKQRRAIAAAAAAAKPTVTSSAPALIQGPKVADAD